MRKAGWIIGLAVVGVAIYFGMREPRKIFPETTPIVLNTPTKSATAPSSGRTTTKSCDSSSEISVLSIKTQKKLLLTPKGNRVYIPLPNGEEAIGLVEHNDQEEGQEVWIQGALEQPQKGRFFITQTASKRELSGLLFLIKAMWPIE
jgi:hypothetical protein